MNIVHVDMEQRNWIATEEIESKQVIPFWTAETCNFSPANVSFRHQPEKLPVSDLNCRENVRYKARTEIQELAICGRHRLVNDRLSSRQRH